MLILESIFSSPIFVESDRANTSWVVRIPHWFNLSLWDNAMLLTSPNIITYMVPLKMRPYVVPAHVTMPLAQEDKPRGGGNVLGGPKKMRKKCAKNAPKMCSLMEKCA